MMGLDRRLRDLERAWKSSGAPGAEAAYLRKRLRTGELGRERLELAAYLGHGAAQVVIEADAPPPEDLREWTGGLTVCGLEVCAKAYLAATLKARYVTERERERAREVALIETTVGFKEVGDVTDSVERALKVLPPEEIRAAICKALLPWCLADEQP